jgi:hypothetical protein
MPPSRPFDGARRRLSEGQEAMRARGATSSAHPAPSICPWTVESLASTRGIAT